MRLKNVLKYTLLIIFSFILFSSNAVSAANEIEVAVAPGRNPGEPDAGSITLYSDNKLVFAYGYRVKDIKIWVCEESLCNIDHPTILPNQTYLGNSIIEFDLSGYLIKDANRDIDYKITATANFKRLETDQNDSSATLNYIITIKAESSSSGRDEDVFSSSEKALLFVNTWIIPGIYVILAAVFIVKAILLTIDLIRYSDNSMVRSEKLKGFGYLFIGLFAVFIVNSCAGYITGLFD